MSPLNPQSRNAVLGGIAAVLAIGLVLLLLWRQTEKIPEIPPAPAESVAAEGFTLFDVGYQTPLTQSLLNHLNSQLGSHAVERRVPIDLTLNYPGFLEENFKELNALNQKLNPSGKARVEHNALKFSYRYARKKNIPFDYIEMIFSGYSHTPAILRVRTRQTGLDLAEALTRKYGPAQTLEWTSKSGRTLWWQEKSGMLFLSEATDRSGILIYEISIYYVDTIEKLLLAEEEELRQKQTERRRKGETAL